MTLYVLNLDTNKKVTLWDVSSSDVVAQLYDNGKKSRKSKCKIRYYNDKAYIVCCGHRYYLDKFMKVDI